MRWVVFKGTNSNSIYDFSTTDIININLKFWLDWSFLNIGAFQTVSVNDSGIYGGDLSRLIPVRDRYYTDGQVWKFPKNNLVWESGLTYQTQPVNISGAYVDNSFNTSLTVDYAQSRIIFDSAISSTSTVQANYSYKVIDIKSSHESQFFKELQGGSLRPDLIDYGIGSGEYEYNRLQLPCIVYETVGKRFTKGYQLGMGHVNQRDIIFHIFSEDYGLNDRLSDIISEQQDKTIFLFDTQRAANSGVFPLEYNGALSDSAKTYNQLIELNSNNGYRWRKFDFLDSTSQQTNELGNNIYHTPVRFITNLVLTNV